MEESNIVIEEAGARKSVEGRLLLVPVQRACVVLNEAGMDPRHAGAQNLQRTGHDSVPVSVSMTRHAPAREPPRPTMQMGEERRIARKFTLPVRPPPETLLTHLSVSRGHLPELPSGPACLPACLSL